MKKGAMFRWVLVLGLGLLGPAAWAQLWNTAFRMPPSADSLGVRQLGLRWEQLGYFHNREYFNPIADGYTAFGTAASPMLAWQASERFRLEGGLFAQNDFGDTDWQVQPIWRARYQQGPWQVMMGALPGHLNHGLIEPLYAFENVFQRRLEQGLQVAHYGPTWQGELWVDWWQKQRPYDTRNERFRAGMVQNLRLAQAGRSTWEGKAQFLAEHSGGQLDTIGLAAWTRFNGGLGLGYRWQRPAEELGFTREFRSEIWTLGHTGDIVSGEPYWQGAAVYAHAGWRTEAGELMLSWFNGSGWWAPVGHDLLQSAGRAIPGPAGYREDHRSILLLRLVRDWEVAPHIFLTLRVEPSYDLPRQRFDYSYGLFVNFRQTFLLKQL